MGVGYQVLGVRYQVSAIRYHKQVFVYIPIEDEPLVAAATATLHQQEQKWKIAAGRNGVVTSAIVLQGGIFNLSIDSRL